MVKKELVDFIRSNLNQGYDAVTIREHLLRYGYLPSDVDEAISIALQPAQIKHTIHMSKTTIIFSVSLLLALALTIYLAYILLVPKAPAKLLDLETEPLTSAVEAGGLLRFKVEILSIGSSKRYDIKLRHEVLDKNNKIITFKEEEPGIETRIAKISSIRIPEDTLPSSYVLKTEAIYDSKKATAVFTFKVKKATAEPTCSDGIKNQGETGIDCGGPCKPCDVKCNCDDNDPCTDDYCDANGVCIHEQIIPCCGNLLCEVTESYLSCPTDCGEAQPQQVMSPRIIIEQAENISSADLSKAGQLCDSLERSRDRDRCYLLIAKRSKNSRVCSSIRSDSKKDTCYMNFAMDGDYSVCDKISNKYLKKSCESLSYMNQIEQT